jgi:hypothetical protein
MIESEASNDGEAARVGLRELPSECRVAHPPGADR